MKTETMTTKFIWHKGPALGGGGTAGLDDEGRPVWYDGDNLLIIIETDSGREIVSVKILADEDYFQVTYADGHGDIYDAWEPESWAWWSKLDDINLPNET